MSSPGSGKTTTVLRTIEALKDEMNIGVLEADIDSEVDAHTVAQAGAKVIQLHTGGMCHLDADMTKQGLLGLGTEGVDFAILENVAIWYAQQNLTLVHQKCHDFKCTRGGRQTFEISFNVLYC